MQGGVGAYTQLLAQHLAAQGHTVGVLSSAGTAEPDERLSLTTLPNWGLAALARVNQWARATRPDVVSLQFETAAYQMYTLDSFPAACASLPGGNDLSRPALSLFVPESRAAAGMDCDASGASLGRGHCDKSRGFTSPAPSPVCRDDPDWQQYSFRRHPT
ncbi:glycosyltransferase [bacterium]|nr:glycosyltransferase [bacterium]